MLLGNADPLIADVDERTWRVAHQAALYGDGTAGRRILDGIGEQVDQDLFHPGWLRPYLEFTRWKVGYQLASLGMRLEPGQDLLYSEAQVKALRLKAKLVRFQARGTE